MIADPATRGRALAGFFIGIEASLWDDIVGGGALTGGGTPLARREWECAALHACVRGLIGAGGFEDPNVDAIDALHEAVVEHWRRETQPPEALEVRQARVSERHAEYARMGRAAGSTRVRAGSPTLGDALARHVSGGAPADPELSTLLGELTEAIVEGATEFVRRGEG